MARNLGSRRADEGSKADEGISEDASKKQLIVMNEAINVNSFRVAALY
jgi:hypothetical protein